MKALEFIYQDSKIHFLLGNEKNVMINATEMAKAFGKRVDVFMKSDHAKNFIKVLEETLYSECELPPNGGSSVHKIYEKRGHQGLWMHRILALKFAAWLDPYFEVWIYSKIEEILFGQYKAIDQKLKERADRKKRIAELEQKLTDNEEFAELQRLQLEDRQSAYGVSKQIKSQLDLFMEN